MSDFKVVANSTSVLQRLTLLSCLPGPALDGCWGGRDKLLVEARGKSEDPRPCSDPCFTV
eukprot:749773-Hanusia_phi.AAC.5